MMKVYAESGSGRTATNGGIVRRAATGARNAIRRVGNVVRGRINQFIARRGRNG